MSLKKRYETLNCDISTQKDIVLMGNAISIPFDRKSYRLANVIFLYFQLLELILEKEKRNFQQDLGHNSKCLYF